MILWWTYQQLRASSPQTRLAVIAKLAETDSADSLEPLLFALKDKEAEVRAAAVSAAGKIKDPRVLQSLLQQLGDASPMVRVRVVEVLGDRGEVQAVTRLTGLLRDPDAEVRGSVSKTLARLGWRPSDDSQRVAQILATGNLQQLTSLGEKAVSPLLELMRTGTPDKQRDAIKALGEISDPRVPTAMLEAIKKSDSTLRLTALEILERMANPATFNDIEKLFRDGNASVRGAALEAAVSCDAKRVIPALLDALKDSSWEVRRIAVKALGSSRDPAAVDGLATILNDSDRDVRESAISALVRIGDRRAIPFLVPVLLDVESALRAAAETALRVLDSKWQKNESVRKALPQVKAALNHQEYWVRQSAVKLFEQLKIDPNTIGAAPAEEPIPAPPQQHPAFSILADLLFDFDRDLRLAAAQALGHLREKGALPILTAAVHDEDRFVQQAAQTALAALN